jgi:NADPH-dependent 2,4-dienoyl-CoA reductase/sulfur reductase-like enzyme
MARYVIVGAGPAGVIAAETLRQQDPDGEIVLLGGEPEPPYSRMAIPYYLTGSIEDSGTHLRKTQDHYGKLGIVVRRDVVSKVDTGANSVVLADGSALHYDQLLLATGASPVRPPVSGLDLPGVHHCWTLEDARAIAKLADPGASVVLMGAGFIGCIILESLLARDVKLTVVEMEDRMLPRMMDQTGGAMIERWCESKGASVLTSTKVTGIKTADGGGLQVELDSGTQIPAALVVVATGVKSNTGLLEGSDVQIDQGIVVDHHLRTNLPNVYAAGDVAQGPDLSTGGWSVLAIQTTAADHGRIAALNMAGVETPHKGSLAMNVLDTAGLVSVSFGRWEGGNGCETAESVDAENYRYMRLVFEEDRVVGALSLGHTDHAGVLRGLIQGAIHLGEWKQRLAADPCRVMEAYLACTMG